MIKKIVTTHVVHKMELIQSAIGQHNIISKHRGVYMICT